MDVSGCLNVPDSTVPQAFHPKPHPLVGKGACAASPPRAYSTPAHRKRKGKMAAPGVPTPLYGHVGRGAFSDVYEPAEDTFLLLDALEAAAAELAGCEEGRASAGENGVFWRRKPELTALLRK